MYLIIGFLNIYKCNINNFYVLFSNIITSRITKIKMMPEYCNETNTITIDGKKYTLVNNQFTHENENYTLYNFTTSMVKHKKNSLSETETKYFDNPMIIPNRYLKDNVEDIINIAHYQLSLSFPNKHICGTDSGMVNAISRMKENINKTLIESESINSVFKNVLTTLFDYIKNINLNKFIANLPNITKFDIKYNDTVENSKVFADLIKYMVLHNNLDDHLINNRSMCLLTDILFFIMLINILLQSISVKTANHMNLSSNTTLILHLIIEFVYNLITMKIDKEMFINQKNEQAKSLILRYFNKYPILSSGKSFDEKMMVLSNDQKFMDEIKTEMVDLYPYIIFYTLADKQRIKLYYKSIKESQMKNKINLDTIKNVNWIPDSEYIVMLQDFANKHSDMFVRYDIDAFTSFINKFININTINEDTFASNMKEILELAKANNETIVEEEEKMEM
ncbi:P51 [Macrobrachium rosenbergii nudivirus]|nr:P51 [Macrobrachium rosenbergii nudivirus]